MERNSVYKTLWKVDWEKYYEALGESYNSFYQSKNGISIYERPNHAFEKFQKLIIPLILGILIKHENFDSNINQKIELEKDSLKDAIKQFQNSYSTNLQFESVSEVISLFKNLATVDKLELEFLLSENFDTRVNLLSSNTDDHSTKGIDSPSFNANSMLFSQPSRFFEEVE